MSRPSEGGSHVRRSRIQETFQKRILATVNRPQKTFGAAFFLPAFANASFASLSESEGSDVLRICGQSDFERHGLAVDISDVAGRLLVESFPHPDRSGMFHHVYTACPETASAIKSEWTGDLTVRTVILYVRTLIGDLHVNMDSTPNSLGNRGGVLLASLLLHGIC